MKSPQSQRGRAEQRTAHDSSNKSHTRAQIVQLPTFKEMSKNWRMAVDNLNENVRKGKVRSRWLPSRPRDHGNCESPLCSRTDPLNSRLMLCQTDRRENNLPLPPRAHLRTFDSAHSAGIAALKGPGSCTELLPGQDRRVRHEMFFALDKSFFDV
jgi:hypothetical protein